MLILLTGEAGNITQYAATALVQKLGPSYWVGIDHGSLGMMDGVYVESPGYPCLAALSQRFVHPTRPNSELRILDVDAIGTSRPKERAPQKSDYDLAPDLKELAASIVKNEPHYRVLVIHSISTLFAQLQAQILVSKLTDWGEKGVEAARTLASNAISQMTWGFAQDPNMFTILTCYDTETTVKGKVTGRVPYLPRSTMQQTDLIYRVAQTDAGTTLETLGKDAGTETVDLATYKWDKILDAI